MNNSDILKKYINLQSSIMFDELMDMGFATLCFCKDDPSPFWNNAFFSENLSVEQVQMVENRFRELDRKPAFWFEHSDDLKIIDDLLVSRKYKQEAEDSLMIYSGGEFDTSKFGNVKKVETQNELEIFLSTFNNCYKVDDPMNPYGELGEYLDVAKNVWIKHNASGRLEYFIVHENDTPVAVSSLTNFEGMGYISNVGSLTSMRGKGYGKLATMYCV